MLKQMLFAVAYEPRLFAALLGMALVVIIGSSMAASIMEGPIA